MMNSGRSAPVSSTETFSFSLPSDLKQAVERSRKDWDTNGNTGKLWKKDASLWTGTDEAQWLGWLDIVDQQLADVSKFKSLAAQVREDGFQQIVLLGMGGSSLAPEVFSQTFGLDSAGPKLLVLDSTDPVQIKSLRDKIDPARTLFCVSSKSGTTLEPNIFMQYFYAETQTLVGDSAGQHFIGVTDPGSKLEPVSKDLGFRHLYYGVKSIGGRFSALSDFGMVPYAAAGYDTEKLLKRTRVMVEKCKEASAATNPGVALGLLLGTAAAKFDRNKVTLICSPAIQNLGAWLEQLLAESTGKQGHGLIPVDREPFVSMRDYGKDRAFAYIKVAGDEEAAIEEHVNSLERAGQPVIRMVLSDPYDIGQAIFQWEIATAVAGSVIGINPFDQPDVEASKRATRELTADVEKNGSLPPEKPILEQDGLKLFADAANAEALGPEANSLGEVIRWHLDRIKTGDYFGLLAYLPMFPPIEERLQEIRREVLESKQAATVLGFGPRFLHSTGQAYKGGPNSGVFLQITCDEAYDLQVPQQKYTFGLVKSAQARGDLETLARRHRRALRVHLGPDLTKDLDRLRNLVCAAVAH